MRAGDAHAARRVICDGTLSESKAVGVLQPGMIFTIEPMLNMGLLPVKGAVFLTFLGKVVAVSLRCDASVDRAHGA